MKSTLLVTPINLHTLLQELTRLDKSFSGILKLKKFIQNIDVDTGGEINAKFIASLISDIKNSSTIITIAVPCSFDKSINLADNIKIICLPVRDKKNFITRQITLVRQLIRIINYSKPSVVTVHWAEHWLPFFLPYTHLRMKNVNCVYHNAPVFSLAPSTLYYFLNRVFLELNPFISSTFIAVHHYYQSISIYTKTRISYLAPLLIPNQPETHLQDIGCQTNTRLSETPNTKKILIFLRPYNSIRAESSKECLKFLDSYEFIENIKIICQGSSSFYKDAYPYTRKAQWYQIQDRNSFFNMLNKADILILPSNNEGIPQTLFEALSCQTAVLSPDSKWSIGAKLIGYNNLYTYSSANEMITHLLKINVNHSRNTFDYLSHCHHKRLVTSI